MNGLLLRKNVALQRLLLFIDSRINQNTCPNGLFYPLLAMSLHYMTLLCRHPLFI